MPKSNKPIVWGFFAAGGTLTAFVTPVLVVLTLLAAVGHVPALLGYDRLHALAAHWVGKAALFGFVFLSLWHAAHRLRVTLYDFGVRSDTLVAWVVYCLAATGSVAAAACLLII
jgi:succinate dehydrogenase subunit D